MYMISVWCFYDARTFYSAVFIKHFFLGDDRAAILDLPNFHFSVYFRLYIYFLLVAFSYANQEIWQEL
jgi:hypothetical protein